MRLKTLDGVGVLIISREISPHKYRNHETIKLIPTTRNYRAEGAYHDEGEYVPYLDKVVTEKKSVPTTSY